MATAEPAFPIQQKSACHVVNNTQTEVSETREQFVAQAFGDYIFVLITQLGKVGTLLRASADVDVNGSASGTFSVQVLLGKRDVEILEIYARQLVETIALASEGNVRPLLLGLALTDTSVESFQTITALVESVRVW